jgi:Yip1 domain
LCSAFTKPMTLLYLYVDPLEFFRKEAAPNQKSLRGPVWVLVALLAIGMADLYLTQRSIFGFLVQSVQANGHLSSPDKQVVLEQLQTVRPIAISAAAFGGCYPLLVWLAASSLLACAAILLNRDPRFREMLRCTGLALAIFCPIQVLSTIVLCWPARVSYNPVAASRTMGELATDLSTLSTLLRNGFPAATVRDLNAFGFFWFGIVLTIGFRQLYRVKWAAAIFSVWGIAALYYGGNLLATHL